MKLSNNVKYYVDFISRQTYSHAKQYTNDAEYVVDQSIHIIKGRNTIYNIFHGTNYCFYAYDICTVLNTDYFDSSSSQFNKSNYSRRQYIEKFFKDYFCKKYILFCLLSCAFKEVRDKEKLARKKEIF